MYSFLTPTSEKRKKSVHLYSFCSCGRNDLPYISTRETVLTPSKERLMGNSFHYNAGQFKFKIESITSIWR